MNNPSDSKSLRLLLLRAHIWLVATLIPLLVKFLPLKRLLRLLTPPARLALYRSIAWQEIAERVAQRLKNPRNMRRRSCLRHSLTLFHFLRLAGYPAVLRIGVYPQNQPCPRIQAHGWVTLHDMVLTWPPKSPVAVVLTHGDAAQEDSAGQGLVRGP
ncbi:MAG: lasso peptide biosynthesis B2 protein [Phycisphaerae bacterium]|nr:lasso peptide biosynthesis B2 protein [Phycisphaerae bacterium]